MREIVEAAHAEAAAAISAVLNDEQKAMFEALRENRADRASARAERRDAFIEDLGLTEAQRQQLEDFRSSHREATRTFMMEQRETRREALEQILTPEQLVKTDEGRARRNRRHARGRGFNRRFKAGHLAERLDLTDSQIQQIKELRESQRKEMQKALEAVLSSQQLEKLKELRKKLL